jgi:PAS domain S-box-containing protein
MAEHDKLTASPEDSLLTTAREVLSYSFLYNSFMEGSDAKLKVDGDTGLIIAVNKQAAPMFGCHPEKLIGLSVDQLVPERYREGHAAFRKGYRAFPKNRSMGYSRQLAGLRLDAEKDEERTEFPAFITLIYQYELERLIVEVTIRRVEDAAPDGHG